MNCIRLRVVTWWTSSGHTVCLTAATSFHSSHRSHELTARRRLADPFNWERASERASEASSSCLHVPPHARSSPGGFSSADCCDCSSCCRLTHKQHNDFYFRGRFRFQVQFLVIVLNHRHVDGFFCSQNVSDLQRSSCVPFHLWLNNHFSHEIWFVCIETFESERRPLCRRGWSRKLLADVAVDVFYCGLTPRKDLNDLCCSNCVKLFPTRLLQRGMDQLRGKRFNII